MGHFLRGFIFLSLMLVATFSSAQLSIDVTVNAGKQTPIAIVEFRGEASAPQNLTPIITNNLARTGVFRMVSAVANPIPVEQADVNFADWASRMTEAILIGGITQLPDGRFDIRYRLFDVAKQMQLAAGQLTVRPTEFRATAHRISDEIYEKLTGERGVFATKVAYVLKRGQRFELQVADADGFNPQTVLSSLEPIGSPKWSPDGTKLAYVTFESRKSNIVVQDLVAGQRRVVANFRGDNYAPSWSPDGTQLAVALSRDAVSQIYTLSANGGEPRRITQSNSIDSGPAFTPDGSTIIFFSDRSGGPQLYSVPAAGGNVKRLTFEGSYNTSPRLSPDGKLVAFVSRDAGKLRIATLELSSGIVNVLTEGPRDDSPSFSPNGRTILFESKVGGRGSLGSVSVDGRIKQRLTSQNGDVREPAWGPYTAANAASADKSAATK
jgi:TolB protein